MKDQHRSGRVLGKLKRGERLTVAPPPSPGPARYLVARDHRLPALRDVVEPIAFYNLCRVHELPGVRRHAA